MWLSDSSVGRKFIMALTGAVLVLFVTFHCLMNAICLAWPTAYNSICMFLGANWYALIASAGLAAFIIVHIVYACWLTVQNRNARGSVRYAVSKTPATVEWSSKNMLVLGFVILAFLGLHMVQFWAKMQLEEILGHHTAIPATAGTLFIQEAFSYWWTPVLYIIAFVALWFHMNHGFWSMFQSVGWNNQAWIKRLKCIGTCWVSVVIALFIAQAVVFAFNANKNYYKTNPELREQYKSMVVPMFEKDFGPAAVQQLDMAPYDQVSQMVRGQLEQLNDPQAKAYFATDPNYPHMLETLETASALFDYLEEPQPEDQLVGAPGVPVKR